MLDPNEKPLGEAIEIFNNTMSDSLDVVLRKLKTQRATLFLEFYGDNSFAGYHEQENHRLTLFDVSLYKKGFMLPKEFMREFEDVVLTPEMLYYGKMNSDIAAEVHNGTLDGMTFEGVVCKSQELIRSQQVSFKVKNRAWLEKLKAKCGENTKLFEQLA